MPVKIQWKNFKRGELIKITDNSDQIINAYFLKRHQIGSSYFYMVQIPNRDGGEFKFQNGNGRIWDLNESRIVSESSI